MLSPLALALVFAAQAEEPVADEAPVEQPAEAEVEAEAADAEAPTGESETAPASPAPAAAAPAVEDPVSGASLEGAISDLMAASVDAVRVAVPPVVDDDAPRAEVVQAAMVRALLDRGREEVVTPAMVKRALGDAAAQMATGQPAAFKSLAADHVLLGEVVDAGGVVELRMRLVHVESGGVLASASAPVAGVAREATANASTVRGGVERAVDQLVTSLEKLPGDRRYQRVAVAPLEAQGDAAEESRLDRFLQSELTSALAGRGYLVVERQRLGSAMNQLALGATMGDDSAGELGKLVDAQALVLGGIAEAGETFSLTLRVVSVETGEVLGAAETQIPRAGAVTLASGSIETRSAGEAAFRSLVAPGWGQFYNRQPVKGLAFATVTYGAALTTLGLGIGSAAVWSVYRDYCVGGCETPVEKRGAEAKGLREQTNALLTATLVSGVLTGVAWGAAGADALIEGLATYSE
jgi:TolB-like protein